jgi:hypothetical protein
MIAASDHCCVQEHSGVQALQLQRLENAGQFQNIEPPVSLRAEQFDTAQMKTSREARTQLRMGERETFSSGNRLRSRILQIAVRRSSAENEKLSSHDYRQLPCDGPCSISGCDNAPYY